MELYVIHLSNYNEVTKFFRYMRNGGKAKDIKSMYKDGNLCVVEMFLHDSEVEKLNELNVCKIS